MNEIKADLIPVWNKKGMLKIFNENPTIKKPSYIFNILKNRAETSVLDKANSDVLLSLLMQRLVWADPDKSWKNDWASDLRIQVNEQPVYTIKAQGWLMREERAPIITSDIMNNFLDLLVPWYIWEAMAKKAAEGATDIDEDFSATLNVNVNFSYKEAVEEKDIEAIESLWLTKPQFLVENQSYPFKTLSRYRVNLSKAQGYPLLVIRKIDSEIPDFFQLWLNYKFLQFISLDRGLVLVTWPTGSWKSTTLAAMINEINKNYRKHIITLENPVEFVHENKKSFFTQRDIPSDSSSFAAWMKSALRQWPDIILFWEMRDPETINWALEAAETGHLVFWTLHTFNAAKTIDRIIGSFPIEWQDQVATQLSTAFAWCISQTLVKTKDKWITALNEMVVATSPIKQAIAKKQSNKIKQSLESDPITHLTMVNHAVELIKANKVDQNEIFWKLYKEDYDAYKELVEKLQTLKIYESDNDQFTPSAIKAKQEEEIEKIKRANNIIDEKEKSKQSKAWLTESWKVEVDMNENKIWTDNVEKKEVEKDIIDDLLM